MKTNIIGFALCDKFLFNLLFVEKLEHLIFENSFSQYANYFSIYDAL